MNTPIGNIHLDYTHYAGSDAYSDGECEQDILNMVQNTDPAAYPAIIAESRDWAYFYHLSHLRHNIVEWLPIEKSHKVLEIGSGLGAVTGILAEKAGEVVCVDLSERRSLINAHRHKEYHDNITIHLGNITDIEPDLPNDFDFVLFIGVIEYSCLYVTAADPYVEMLLLAQRHLKADGHLAIAIENRLGLKYFAGAPEDHLGTYYAGLEGYPGGNSRARTFTRPQWEKMLSAAGIRDYHFYYPYPDYKFMTTLYSDERLPRKGELYDNTRNFDRHRMENFNERRVFDSLIAEGLFPLFSNAYFIYTGKDTDTAYVRYSNDRAPKYQVRTHISKGLMVVKTPLTIEAVGHTQQMLDSYHALSKEYKDKDLAINECRMAADKRSVEFVYVKGGTLTERLDECLHNRDMATFNKLLDKFVALTQKNATDKPTQGYNRDLTFGNIILDEYNNGKWTLIDYEWMVEEAIEPEESAFRALHCYLQEDDSRQVLNPANLYRMWGVTADDIADYREKERAFQKMVAGNYLSAAQMREACGLMSVNPQPLVESFVAGVAARHVQLFLDTGKGFSEEESLHLLAAYQNEQKVVVDVLLPSNLRRLRLDPADAACVVRIESCAWNGAELPLAKKPFRTNGKRLNNGCYLFNTTDPNIHINIKNLKKLAENRLEMCLTVAILPV